VKKSYTFPKNFLWGTATAAHQIEGNNKNSDWWEWEQNKPPERKWPLEPSLDGCDSYNRYEEDFDLCKQMNNNAVRFSIEWARIEPEEGKFDQKEIEHYKKVLQAAKDRGLKTLVTLHHFTNPNWLTKFGGWVHPKTSKLFARYAKKCAEEFGEYVDLFTTFNEPQVYAGMSYVKGIWPPARHNPFKVVLVQINMIRAHNKAYKKMREVTKIPIGLVKHIVCPECTDESILLDRIVARVVLFLGADFFLIGTKKYLDFIGLNFYFTFRLIKCRIRNLDDRVSDLGWWIYAPGIEKVLVFLKKYNLPIYITENGLADAKDKYRPEFIRDHLIACAKAIDQGVDLKGYFHWSLLDNYEWAEGYWPRFGLVEIDRENNLERKPRKSFHYYSEICKNYKVSEDDLTDIKHAQNIQA
jgi:beta-glucosidase